MLTRKLGIVFAVVCFIQYSESGLHRKFNYDAKLYEHFSLDSRYIQYSRTEPDDWKNIQVLADSKEFSFTSMICTMGPGAWIFYPDPDYEMGNSQTYYLVIGEHCVRADDIESVQPLGRYDELLEQGVLLFEKPNFASPQTIITEDGSGEGGSLIFTGPTSFVIEGSSKKICLRPSMSIFDDDAYCLVPNLKASFGIEGTVSVLDECANDTDTEVKQVLQNCYMAGVHEIYTDQDLAIDKINEVCTGSPNDFLKSKFYIVLEMWGKRLQSESVLKTQVQALDIKNTKKLAILWAILEVFETACMSVPGTYTFLLGHLYAMHLKHLWNNDTNYNGTTTTHEQWDWAADFFLKCKHDDINTTFDKQCSDTDKFNRLADNAMNGFTEANEDWYDIVNGDMFDPVIEQMWLIMNFVLPICNIQMQYVNNDWSEMAVILRENYLDPLNETWVDPGDWTKVYTAVFHGFDMRDVHKEIISCLRGALEQSPSYDPIGRPDSLRHAVKFHKYQTPDYGKIHKANETRSKRQPKKQ